jgi:predicted 2-oxoglutarate/Fe(II)-dependent dioxygenase YbiX
MMCTMWAMSHVFKRNCLINLNKSINIKANHLHNVSPILSATSLFHNVLYL